ncbi:MAG: GNAT family N-acetyltransferase [Planctomycetota bacterium]
MALETGATELRIVAVDHRKHEVAAAIHAVQMAAYAQEARLLAVERFPPLDRTVADLQKTPEKFWIAADAEDVIGAISVGPDDTPNSMNIGSLVVLPMRQREGIARRLVAAVIAQHGTAPITVSTGLRNVPALTLYAQFGFIEFHRCSVGAEPIEIVKLRRPSVCSR